MSGQVKCNNKNLSVSEEKKKIAVQLLLDSFSICSTVKDEYGIIVDFLIEYVSENARPLANLDLKKCIGKSLLELFPEFNENGALKELSEVVSTGIPFTTKTALHEEKDGIIKVNSVYDVRVVRLDDGIAATWRNITNEEKLEETHNGFKKVWMNANGDLRRLAEIVESSDDAIISKDIDGYIISWNKGAERIYGYSAQEVKGKHITVLVPPGKELEVEGIMNRIRQGLHISHYETIRKRKDGVLLEVSITVSPIFDNKGKIIGASTIARDITSRKQLEKTLIESEERYRMLIEFLPYGVFVHQEGKIIFVNTGGVKLLGVNSINELLGKNFKDFTYLDENNIVEQHKEVFDNNGHDVVACKGKVVRADGTVINVEAISTKLCYRNSQAVLTVVKDITAEIKADYLQKQVEENARRLYEAREYDKLRTEFFTNISHELKTPLNIILSSLQLFELLTQNNKYENNEMKIEKLTNSMKKNCYRLLRMINNLLDVTRIDTGFYKLYLQNCNIVSVVEDVVLSAAEYVRNKGIDLQFDTEIEEKIIACDPDKIERIILNLLSNAVKFNKKKGSIFVKIYMDNNFVYISVKDNGIGIEKDKLGMIFERFRQVDKSLTRDCEGSGIGLSIVKSLIEMHGGTIEVKSEYGEGSEFIVSLPERKTEDDSQNLDYIQRSIAGDNVGNSEIEKLHIEFSDIYFNR